MNIAFVVRSWIGGGEQRAASVLTQALAAMGHRVSIHVLSARGKQSDIIAVDPRVSLVFPEQRGRHRIGRGRLCTAFLCVRDAVGRDAFDVVIGFGATAAILLCLAAWRTRTPIVVCERNDPSELPLHWRALRLVAYRRANGAIFQTVEASACFSSARLPNRIVIPNPVDPQTRLMVVDQADEQVVCTSRLTTAKNHKLLLAAFAEIADEFPMYQLKIFGEGPYEPALRQEVERRNLQDRVRFMGLVPNILDQISSARIFVLSSNHEGYPNSLAEAMSMGLACVSTDCRIGGPRSMIRDGRNGYLVKVADVGAMAAALRRLMADPVHARKLGQQSRAWAECLEPYRIAQTWEHFMTPLVKREGGRGDAT